MPSNPDYCCWLWRRSLDDLYVNDNNRFNQQASSNFKRSIDRNNQFFAHHGRIPIESSRKKPGHNSPVKTINEEVFESTAGLLPQRHCVAQDQPGFVYIA
ncbi:hypothetical protein NA645_10150, partial [Pseudomonas stutzeri]|uniref:hypothetical protein n=1 Tax=Stutzerimonas stutzeri TaxID=316 RepID=UPI00210F0AA2